MHNNLQQGDLLGIRKHTALGMLTTLCQSIAGHGDMSAITHVSIARQMHGVWYSQEMDGKYNILRPLSQYSRQGIVVSVFRADLVVSPERNINAVMDRYIDTEISYSIIDLLKIGFHLVFRFKRNGAHDDDKMVCSGYAAAILQALGWVAPMGLNKMPSPSELCMATQYIFDIAALGEEGV